MYLLPRPTNAPAHDYFFSYRGAKRAVISIYIQVSTRDLGVISDDIFILREHNSLIIRTCYLIRDLRYIRRYLLRSIAKKTIAIVLVTSILDYFNLFT